MTTIEPATPTLNRRSLLKFSLGATLLLNIAGCGSDIPANRYLILRDADLPMLRAIIPVIVTSNVDTLLAQLDTSLAALSPAMLKLTRQLFDVLSLPITRGPLTGIWGAWDQAEPAQVERFLKRWENSSLNLLRQGHCSLLQLVLMAWYSSPASWASCGYPGPPKI
ncbi:twin-arginine translocation pathway signal protein [Pseudomonas fontis]|uniref:Twin-arginine translocation pathway signal protein n=1 Tax=Pseudomonas fontis TaxID=2942633 RepID=A0ABT5NRW1_9PSED|nr:twin-arginine translocation pathway signal protein [Pseudomonas fontis]MDD0973608.1 twin-arginine translocation pathway signal protein [Pseudomonas fontis]MDD0990905.1 twin-arginine translocation pathway signal protein [Pseudomonas fontis]